MDKLKLKPVKFILPFRFFEINIIIYINLNKEMLLNENKSKKITQ